MFKRLRGFVNRIFGREPPPALPPLEPPAPPPIPSPPPLPPPPQQPPPPIDDYGNITVTDAFGNQYTQSLEDWYADTLLNKDQFAGKYGWRLDQIEVIYELIAAGVDWDWQQWRQDYKDANG